MRMPHLAAAVALMAMPACGEDESAGIPADSGTGSSVVAPPSSSIAARETAPVWREVTASVVSLNHIVVAAEVAGRVMSVHAEAGDRLESGSLLAEQDETALLAARNAAAATLELAQGEAERTRRLFEERVASQRDLDEAATELRRAAAEVELADTALAQARVLSPADAIVEARYVGPGDLAHPGTPLFALYDPSRMALELSLPEGDRRYAALGTELPWEIQRQSGLGMVSEVAPSADPRSRTVRVRIALDRAIAAGLPPGSFGTVRYAIGQREAVLIPPSAVRRVGQLETVDVLDKAGVWRRRHVRTGRSIDGRVEILSGLDGGETVGTR